MPAERLASPRRSTVLALLAALATVVAMIPLATAGRAQPPSSTTRLQAQSNVEAAIAYSQTTFPDGSARAFLGRYDVFADMLSSGGAQGVFDAPLLLTDKDALSDETAAELERLGVTEVIILGGPAAVSEAVEEDLEERYQVTRLAGPTGTTRIETAIGIAATIFADADTAILARAYGSTADPTAAFADSLAAGGWAADAEYPILLTEGEQLSASTAEYLESSQIETVYVVGGQGAISEAVVLQLRAMGITVERIAEPGGNRASTAVAIAKQRGYESASDAPAVILTEGFQNNAYAAGFPAAALADLSNAPIVLSNDQSLPAETRAYLEGDGVATATDLVCGPYTTDEACDEAEDALGIGAEECPTATATPTTTTSPTETASPLISLPPGLAAQQASPSPCPTTTDGPTVTASPTGSPTGSASPSPSPTCIPGTDLCLPD